MITSSFQSLKELSFILGVFKPITTILLHRIQNHILDSKCSNGMIEAFAFIVPLVSQLSVARVDQSLIDRDDVLLSAYSRHIRVCCLETWDVVISDTEREPSLPNLRVSIASEIQVTINFSEYFSC